MLLKGDKMDNKKILATVRPFDIKQNLSVYDNGNKVFSQDVTLDEMNQGLYELITHYNITQVDFYGAKPFSRGLIKKFQKTNWFTNYENKDNIIFNLIGAKGEHEIFN